MRRFYRTTLTARPHAKYSLVETVAPLCAARTLRRTSALVPHNGMRDQALHTFANVRDADEQLRDAREPRDSELLAALLTDTLIGNV